MKFKPEDIGLYFAMGLTGAGIGLLIGALVAQRLKKEDEYEESLVIDEEEVKARVKIEAAPYQPPHEERDLDGYTDEEKAIIEAIRPTEMQFEMLRRGVITLEKLEKEHKEYMKRVKMAEQADPDDDDFSYNKPYKPKKSSLGSRKWVDPDEFEDEDFEELEEFDEESVIFDDENDGKTTDDDEKTTDDVLIDGNLDDDDLIFLGNDYAISTNPSLFDGSRRFAVKNQIVFDGLERAFSTISLRGHVIPVTDLRKYVSEKGLEIVIEILENQGGPVYVQDLESLDITEFNIEEKEDDD